MLWLRYAISASCPQFPDPVLGKLGLGWESYGDDLFPEKHGQPLPKREVVFSTYYRRIVLPLR